jgi:hypothetical protein
MPDNDPTLPPGEPNHEPITPDRRDSPPPLPVIEPGEPAPQPQVADPLSGGEGLGDATDESLKQFGDAFGGSEGPAQDALDRATASLGDEDIGVDTDRLAGEVQLEDMFERNEDMGDGTHRTGDVDPRDVIGG